MTRDSSETVNINTTRSTQINCFVITDVDYCNSLLAGFPAYQLDQRQSVLNFAAQLIYGHPRYEHITRLLRDNLHWLKVPQKIQFKSCLFVYKTVNGLVKNYIANFSIRLPVNERTSSLRSASRNANMLVVPRSTKFGERSFSVSGPTA